MNFREWMNSKQLTYDLMSHKIGIASGTIARWANKGVKPRLGQRILLLKAYPDCPKFWVEEKVNEKDTLSNQPAI